MNLEKCRSDLVELMRDEKGGNPYANNRSSYSPPTYNLSTRTSCFKPGCRRHTVHSLTYNSGLICTTASCCCEVVVIVVTATDRENRCGSWNVKTVVSAAKRHMKRLSERRKQCMSPIKDMRVRCFQNHSCIFYEAYTEAQKLHGAEERTTVYQPQLFRTNYTNFIRLGKSSETLWNFMKWWNFTFLERISYIGLLAHNSATAIVLLLLHTVALGRKF